MAEVLHATCAAEKQDTSMCRSVYLDLEVSGIHINPEMDLHHVR